MTDLEARIVALEQSLYVVAVALRDMQTRLALESSLTHVRLCECAQRDATLDESMSQVMRQCVDGFGAITLALQAIRWRLGDDDGPTDWRDDSPEL